ncbi:MAG: hypothetical protein SFT68_03750 [Rickettsiaceae bacterium]|nr:hypothetical protein [Rickettsiaceae bacterium]
MPNETTSAQNAQESEPNNVVNTPEHSSSCWEALVRAATNMRAYFVRAEQKLKPEIEMIKKEIYPLLEQINKDAEPIAEAIAESVKAGNVVLLTLILNKCFPHLSPSEKSIIINSVSSIANTEVDNVKSKVIRKLNENIEGYEETKINDANPDIVTNIASDIAGSYAYANLRSEIMGNIQNFNHDTI